MIVEIPSSILFLTGVAAACFGLGWVYYTISKNLEYTVTNAILFYAGAIFGTVGLVMVAVATNVVISSVGGIPQFVVVP